MTERFLNINDFGQIANREARRYGLISPDSSIVDQTIVDSFQAQSQISDIARCAKEIVTKGQCCVYKLPNGEFVPVAFGKIISIGNNLPDLYTQQILWGFSLPETEFIEKIRGQKPFDATKIILYSIPHQNSPFYLASAQEPYTEEGAEDEGYKVTFEFKNGQYLPTLQDSEVRNVRIESNVEFYQMLLDRLTAKSSEERLKILVKK